MAAVRHRLLAAALEYLPGLQRSDLVQDKRVLHFAVEPGLQDLVQPFAGQYVGTDYCAPTCRYYVNVVADMGHLAIAQGSFDLVVACDVLEHVPNDGVAMKELYRILAGGGYAILTVPQKDGLLTTLEDPGVTSPAERERVYGQGDHLRLYGQDFAHRLQEAGFEVQEVCEDDFPPAVAGQHVLYPPVLSDHPLAPNFRKLCFARKPR
jgi:SAM-dependent methyltransferase